MSTYRNAMEVLVEEEVDRQIKGLPARTAAYLNRVELIAYALNQLPALYATSERGLNYQLQRGRNKFSAQITQAVMRALAAIRRDPIRAYVPLQLQQATSLRDVLNQLRVMLKNDKIDWETLPTAVEKALHGAKQTGMAMIWDAQYQSQPQATSSEPPPAKVPPAKVPSAKPLAAARSTSHPAPPQQPSAPAPVPVLQGITLGPVATHRTGSLGLQRLRAQSAYYADSTPSSSDWSDSSEWSDASQSGSDDTDFSSWDTMIYKD